MKTQVDLEEDKQSDLVNLRTSMAIALLLLGAMISANAPLWGLGLEIAAAGAIVAVRRPWVTGSRAPHRRINARLEPLTNPEPPRDVRTPADQPQHRQADSPNELRNTTIAPVFDVGADKIVGLRTSLHWASESNSVLRSTSAAIHNSNAAANPWISATVDADGFEDSELLSKIDLFLRASGLTPDNLILEIEGWHESRKNRSTIDRLLDHGIGIGLCMRKGDAWPLPPKTFSSKVSIYSVSASDITHRGEVTLDGMANIEAFSQTRLDRVVVRDVDRACLALDLGSVGLKLQAGEIFNTAQISLRSSGAFSS